MIGECPLNDNFDSLIRNSLNRAASDIEIENPDKLKKKIYAGIEKEMQKVKEINFHKN